MGELPLPAAAPWPFYLDYAGNRQVHVKLTVLRTGTALVAQGCVGLGALLLGLALGRRRRGRPGLVAAALGAALLVRFVAEPLRPYAVMAAAGFGAALFVLVVERAWAGKRTRDKGRVLAEQVSGRSDS
jgi:hypothetical protein